MNYGRAHRRHRGAGAGLIAWGMGFIGQGNNIEQE